MEAPAISALRVASLAPPPSAAAHVLAVREAGPRTEIRAPEKPSEEDTGEDLFRHEAHESKRLDRRVHRREKREDQREDEDDRRGRYLDLTM